MTTSQSHKQNLRNGAHIQHQKRQKNRSSRFRPPSIRNQIMKTFQKISIACLIRSTFSSFTFSLPFKKFETVPTETPAILATSLIVDICSFLTAASSYEAWKSSVIKSSTILQEALVINWIRSDQTDLFLYSKYDFQIWMLQILTVHQIL